MSEPYRALDKIWTLAQGGESVDIEPETLGVLSRHGIKIRQHDGDLKQITLSRPTTIQSSYVIGLRYTKLDGTHTEDHFLCPHNGELERHYRGSLEHRLSEYRGTHKQQVDLAQPSPKDSTITGVNTISFWVPQRGHEAPPSDY